MLFWKGWNTRENTRETPKERETTVNLHPGVLVCTVAHSDGYRFYSNPSQTPKRFN